MRVLTGGVPVGEAAAALLLLHGRGGSPEGMLELARQIEPPGSGVAHLAPEAPGRTWYPHGFLEPLERNEPHLTSGLDTVAALVERLEGRGIGAGSVAIVGFSQGGCLGLEFGARNARRYGALVGLSAGLIGPAGTSRDYGGDLAGTPVFLGCSDVDPHIPLWRLEETAGVLEGLGGAVEKRVYPGMAHTVARDEVRRVRDLLAGLPGVG